MIDHNLGSPLDPDFGVDFDYSSWDENTELFLTNAPWNSDYRDIVVMDSRDALNAWIDSQSHYKYTNSSMQKFNEGIVKIDLPMNDAMKYNYLRARNGANPISGAQRDYYYFITGLRYGAPNTTYVSLQLDVIPTFLPEVTFGQVYAERGHISIANTHQFDAFGRDYLTTPEGLDLGGEYQIAHTARTDIMRTDVNDDDPLAYDVLVCSTLDLTQSPGTPDNPSLASSLGMIFEGVPSGADFYLFKTAAQFTAWMAVHSVFPWITQSIISVTAIPSMGRYVPNYNYGANLGDSNLQFYKAGGLDHPQPHTVAQFPDWRNNSFISDLLGSKYGILKKFLTYPYMVIELTTWTGSPLIIKPESWQDPDATVREMAALVPPGQRIVIMPHRYNVATGAPDPSGADDGGEFLDFAAVLDNFPTFPVVNNMALSYLASNKHGIAFQFSSADWTQQRALNAAGASVEVQNAQIANTARQSSIANNRDTQASSLSSTTAVQNSIIGAAGSVPDLGLGAVGGMRGAGAALEGGRRSAGASSGQLAGAGASAVGGGVGSAAAGMLQAGNSASTALQLAQIANSARGESAISDIQTAGSVRDTNNTFATTAAKGDYANTIAGIQAKLQDSRMIQPSTSGQFGGDAFNLVNNQFGYSLRWKLPSVAAIRKLGDYWLRYGYAIDRFITMPASLHCMSRFTYWKLSETYITQGAFPEGFKQIIRGIFEKGVTVWKNPDYIGRTALEDNQPLGGISY